MLNSPAEVKTSNSWSWKQPFETLAYARCAWNSVWHGMHFPFTKHIKCTKCKRYGSNGRASSHSASTLSSSLSAFEYGMKFLGSCTFAQTLGPMSSNPWIRSYPRSGLGVITVIREKLLKRVNRWWSRHFLGIHVKTSEYGKNVKNVRNVLKRFQTLEKCVSIVIWRKKNRYMTAKARGGVSHPSYSESQMIIQIS